MTSGRQLSQPFDLDAALAGAEGPEGKILFYLLHAMREFAFACDADPTDDVVRFFDGRLRSALERRERQKP